MPSLYAEVQVNTVYLCFIREPQKRGKINRARTFRFTFARVKCFLFTVIFIYHYNDSDRPEFLEARSTPHGLIAWRGSWRGSGKVSLGDCRLD